MWAEIISLPSDRLVHTSLDRLQSETSRAQKKEEDSQTLNWDLFLVPNPHYS